MEIFRLNIFDNIYFCGEGGEAWINMINVSRGNRRLYQVFQYCSDKYCKYDRARLSLISQLSPVSLIGL